MDTSNLTRTERCKICKEVQIKAKNTYEVLFLNILKKRNLTVLYQRIISPYILDFYLPGYGLAIEIDGEIHNKRAVEMRDNHREAYIASFGIRVMRYNTSINRETPEQFIDYLLSNFPKISKCRRTKINTKIDRVYQILGLKDFHLEKIKCYQQVDKKHHQWQKHNKEKSELKRIAKKCGEEKAIIKLNYYKNQCMPERLKPKLANLYTMKIKRMRNSASTI